MIATGGYVVAFTSIMLMHDLANLECRDCAEHLFGTPISIAHGGDGGNQGVLYIECKSCGARNYIF